MAGIPLSIEFPGIKSARSARYTGTLGTFPDAAIVSIVPQTELFGPDGTLVLKFGSDEFRLFDCRVDIASLRFSLNGQIIEARILDRRWPWKFGDISGHYNGVLAGVRGARLSASATAKELAALLFEAMGELNADVNAMPEDQFPGVDWECDNPAKELTKLCSLYGCAPGLRISDNRAAIFQFGHGAELPNRDEHIRSVSYSLDKPESPRSLKVCAGGTVFQMKLALVAVGQDVDASLTNIDNLSYAPSDGWESINMLDRDARFSEIDDPTARHLAEKYVFRLYQVAAMADGSLDLPGFGALTSMSQILPIRSELVDGSIGLDGSFQALPSFIDGEFAVGGDPETFTNTVRGTIWQGSFQTIGDSGLVLLSRPAFRWTEDADGIEEALLWLTTSFQVSDFDTGLLERVTLQRQISNNNTEPLVSKRFDIFATKVGRYGIEDVGAAQGATLVPDSIEDTTGDTETELGLHLDAAQKEFSTTEVAQNVVYRGLQAIDPDGLQRQVTWEVSIETGCQTWVYRNMEAEIGAPRYREKVRALLK
jgi:hypothetical protein